MIAPSHNVSLINQYTFVNRTLSLVERQTGTKRHRLFVCIRLSQNCFQMSLSRKRHPLLKIHHIRILELKINLNIKIFLFCEKHQSVVGVIILISN